jgi:hypothetical protein
VLACARQFYTRSFYHIALHMHSFSSTCIFSALAHGLYLKTFVTLTILSSLAVYLFNNLNFSRSNEASKPQSPTQNGQGVETELTEAERQKRAKLEQQRAIQQKFV